MASNKEVKNRETINIALDETKSTVKKTTDEALNKGNSTVYKSR